MISSGVKPGSTIIDIGATSEHTVKDIEPAQEEAADSEVNMTTDLVGAMSISERSVTITVYNR